MPLTKDPALTMPLDDARQLYADALRNLGNGNPPLELPKGVPTLFDNTATQRDLLTKLGALIKWLSEQEKLTRHKDEIINVIKAIKAPNATWLKGDTGSKKFDALLRQTKIPTVEWDRHLQSFKAELPKEGSVMPPSPGPWFR